MMVITLTAGTCAVARWVLLLSETESIPSMQEKKKSISGDSALRALSPACVGSMRPVAESERHKYLWVCRYLCCYSLDPHPKFALNIEKIGDDIDNQHRFVYNNVFTSLKTRSNFRYSNFVFGVPESIFS